MPQQFGMERRQGMGVINSKATQPFNVPSMQTDQSNIFAAEFRLSTIYG